MHAWRERGYFLKRRASYTLRFIFLVFYWLFLFHRTLCDVHTCGISGNSGIPGIFGNWAKIWLYFVITFKWLCCHLKFVVANNLGFLPKFGMSAAVGMHNLSILIKLKTAFFSLAKLYLALIYQLFCSLHLWSQYDTTIFWSRGRVFISTVMIKLFFWRYMYWYIRFVVLLLIQSCFSISIDGLILKQLTQIQ